MYTCKVCKSTDFYKEAGYFFCQTCQTQNENIREEVFELRVDNTTRLRRTRIRQLKSDASGEELGWTSWEVYNFVLIGLTNELIELGVTPDIKMTILQLWATYLGKLEVAFISTKHKSIPKLARRYNRRDAAIIYGKVKTQKRSKRRRRSGSSTNTSISGFQSEGSSAKELSRNKKLLVAADYDRYLQSQASSEMDDTNTVSQSMYSDQTGSIKSSDNGARVRFSSHAQKEAKKIKRLSKNIPKYKRSKYKASHISTQYKVGPHIITPMKLWAIIYLALRVHHQPIQLGDMLSAASNQNSFNDKLFSFNEWQRYIECRKTILAHAHFPTKMKYSLESVGINDSYVKFLEHISSKTDKKEPDAKNSKHFLPDDLISAMTKHITNLSINDLSPKTIEIFPPSLTPLHSYFQQLLDHPYYDIPNIARSDFFLAKVGYTTKPNLLIELADQYNVRLEVVDSNLHFLEKYVPPFEQPKMPSIKELQQLVDIQDDSKSKRVNEYENLNANESLNDYLHAKLPCKMKFDVAKHQYYDKSKSTMKHFNDIDVKNDFIFMETLPNGKLAIPTSNDSEDKNEEENTPRQENMLLKTAFCDKYNLQLSLAEKDSVNNLDTTTMAHFRKQKSKMARNTKGQFIKDSIEKVNKSGEHVGLGNSAQLNTTDERHSNFDDIDAITKVETVFSNVPDSYDANDISTSYGNTDVSTLVTSKENNTNVERFFRPFKEYWMYHCIFSRVKPKNFAVFERALPRTFRWLLNECALTVEMSTEDLYEEVCLIEAYHTHVLKSCNSENVQYSEPISKNQLNLILSKW
ncbi:TATA box-binding protein-associated factor RNA polymerase I subunit B isoform X3 [Megachile rotundata]|uniref:TATA box-binding protein-associated factor RNA polymerase I subunit B isoform X3 n=1 Tax=Megachile rotundata TaxID=143995 RepID=UPI003FD3BC29